jgi:hypothetical protein
MRRATFIAENFQPKDIGGFLQPRSLTSCSEHRRTILDRSRKGISSLSHLWLPLGRKYSRVYICVAVYRLQSTLKKFGEVTKAII